MCVDVYVYVSTSIYENVSVFNVCMYPHIYVCIHIHTHMHIHICTCMTYTSICMYVSVCAVLFLCLVPKYWYFHFAYPLLGNRMFVK